MPTAEVFACKALAPTTVLVDAEPAPLPTVSPSIEPAPVTVKVLDAVTVVKAPLEAVVAPTVPLMLIEAVPLAVVNTVPLVEGKVSTVEPDTAGACRVTEPDVSPEITTELIFFP
jgi:hypothetical protein